MSGPSRIFAPPTRFVVSKKTVFAGPGLGKKRPALQYPHDSKQYATCEEKQQHVNEQRFEVAASNQVVDWKFAQVSEDFKLAIGAEKFFVGLVSSIVMERQI